MRWDPDKVQVGATVAIIHGAGFDGMRLYTIERLTRTQAHISLCALDRATGRIRGAGQWGPFRAFMPTDEQIREVHRRVLADHLRRTDWSKLSHETLRAVFDLLPAEAKP